MANNINRRDFLQKAALGAAAASLPHSLRAADPPQRADNRPNIVFIVADDLGYGDLGCYGQVKFQTPNIDRIASEGIRFSQCYSGSTICAPSRSVLMTGQHTGHTRVRGNMCIVGGSVGYKGKQQVRRMYLTDEDRTIGHVLQKAGYRTGVVGKWHLDGYNPDAGPLNRGFDEFYGWLTSEAATSNPTYYPAKRFRNRELYDVPGNENNGRRIYHEDMSTNEAVEFLKNNKDRRFFLYLAYNLPHSPLDIPDLGPYKNKDWPNNMKTYAAMVHRLDQHVGKVMQTLKDLSLDEKTIVFFCSDNGPRSEDTTTLTEVADFFDSNGPLRGYKRDLYEGGIRVPMLVRWPGKVPAGSTRGECDTAWYFADVLPTLAELAGVEPPKNIDGVSVVPTLLGKIRLGIPYGTQDMNDRFLYWEFFERGFEQAVRWRNYKAIRPKLGQPLMLFDLSEDLGEQHDIAAELPDVISRIEDYLKTARTESPNWPVRMV